jgi:hypothetical protein
MLENHYLQPSIIETIENIFSQFVVGLNYLGIQIKQFCMINRKIFYFYLTLPKPTLVKLVRVKNNAVIYLLSISGPDSKLSSMLLKKNN